MTDRRYLTRAAPIWERTSSRPAEGPPPIELVENGPAADVRLTLLQVVAMQDSGVVKVSPGDGSGRWLVAPGKYVGAARIGGLEVWVRPKLAIRRLMFLLGYAYNLSPWRDGRVEVDEAQDLMSAIAAAFARQAERAVEQGLLQGYRSTDESAPVLRGRVRTDEQLRRRFGLLIPLEVRFDDYTVDIAENRILRTAAEPGSAGRVGVGGGS